MRETDNDEFPGVSRGLLYGAERQSVKELTLTEEEKTKLMQEASEPLKYSNSVQHQNQKVLELYQHFTHEMHLDSFRLTATSAVSFLMWLASTNHYCAKTLDDVVFSSLCRRSSTVIAS